MAFIVKILKQKHEYKATKLTNKIIMEKVIIHVSKYERNLSHKNSNENR